MMTAPYPTPRQLAVMYEANEEVIQKLSQQRVISLDDVTGRHKNILTRLTSDQWGSLSEAARSAMLSHTHHFVRSCAVVSKAHWAQILSDDLGSLRVDHLLLRRQDVVRRAAEMEADEEVQLTILEQGSQGNALMLALNADLRAINACLNTLEHREDPTNFIWI